MLVPAILVALSDWMTLSSPILPYVYSWASQLPLCARGSRLNPHGKGSASGSKIKLVCEQLYIGASGAGSPLIRVAVTRAGEIA